VESVIMTYDSRKAAGRERATGGGEAAAGGVRRTLCVSSQAGCAMACTFCATGAMGHLGDLTAAEIVEQLDWAGAVAADADAGAAAAAARAGDLPPPSFLASGRRSPIRNVVFMGMGEPLNNYDAVVAAARAMTDGARFGLRAGGVTISTVGVVPRLASLAADLPRVSLALSLHAPNQAIRARIVPSARAWPLDRLLRAVGRYQAATSRRVFVEYVLLAGVNDAPAHAAELASLLAGRDVVVNVIPWNPVPPPPIKPVDDKHGASSPPPPPPELFAAPSPAALDAFVAVLRGRGVPVTVRQEKGQDVAAACGQLALASVGVATSGPKTSAPTSASPPPDVEDLVPAPPPTPARAGLGARLRGLVFGKG
jgi:adenine C2-methylase RlmN of 23S rRNA A2503 and tRNA A37